MVFGYKTVKLPSSPMALRWHSFKLTFTLVSKRSTMEFFVFFTILSVAGLTTALVALAGFQELAYEAKRADSSADAILKTSSSSEVANPLTLTNFCSPNRSDHSSPRPRVLSSERMIVGLLLSIFLIEAVLMCD
jgi:hypothetical protein